MSSLAVRSLMRLGLACASFSASCEEGAGRLTCEPSSDAERRISGKLEVHYAGAIGPAPSSGWLAYWKTGSEGWIELRACNDTDGDLWSLAFQVRAPAGSDEFGEGKDQARAAANLARCRDASCGSYDGTAFGWPLIEPPILTAEVTGTLSHFEAGALKADVTLRDTSPGNFENGRLRVVADITWQPAADGDD